MGADQSLYAYVGERIRAGGLPYRDAWDQKPPAIHSLCRAADAVARRRRRRQRPISLAAGARRVAAVRLGRALGPAGAGRAAALLFLLLSNPALTRLAASGCARSARRSSPSSVAGCAAACCVRGRKGSRRRRLVSRRHPLRPRVHVQVQRRGVRDRRPRRAVAVQAARPSGSSCASPPGSLVPVAGDCCWSSRSAAALRPLVRRDDPLQPPVLGRDLRRARSNACRYLLTFPIERARADALWTAGRRRLPRAAGRHGLAARAADPGRLGRSGVRVDRDQRQPQPAAVLHPGAPGARRLPPAGRRARLELARGRPRTPGDARGRSAGGARRDRRRGASATIRFRSSSSRPSSMRATRSAGSPARRISPATTTTGSTRRSRRRRSASTCERTAAPPIGSTSSASPAPPTSRRPRQRLALLLEPAGDRRVQRGPARLRHRRAALGSRS